MADSVLAPYSPLHVYVRLLAPGGAVEIEPTAHSYFPEAREDLWFFSERDRQAVPHGRDLDRREAVAIHAIQVALELERRAWSLAASAYLARSSRTLVALEEFELEKHVCEVRETAIASIDRDLTLCYLASAIIGGLSGEAGEDPEALMEVEEKVRNDPELQEGHAVQRFLRRAREVCAPSDDD